MKRETLVQNANMRWTLPLEHLSIATLFIVVGLLMNLAQCVAFLLCRPINRTLYRKLAHVSRQICVLFISSNLVLPMGPLVNSLVDWLPLLRLRAARVLL